jgi:uncharacterized protein
MNDVKLTVRPSERLPALDLVRGVSILLMLPATIPWFCRPFQWWDAHPHPVWDPDRLVIALTLFFVDHKVLTLLSLLFGMGLGLQMRRPQGQGKPFLRYYLWRMLLLFLLGIAHTLLLWWGDVLTTYAIVGAHVLVIATLGSSMERMSLAICFGWYYLLVGVVGFLSIVPLERIGGPDLRLPPAKVSNEGPPLSLFGGDESFAEALLKYIDPKNQQRIYRNGSFADQVAQRVFLRFKEELVTIVFSFWYMLGCALLGFRFVQWGLLDDGKVRGRWSRWFVVFGLAVGLPFQLLAAVVYYAWDNGSLAWSLSQFGALPLALFYLAVLLAVSDAGWWPRLQRSLRAVGRLALSNYLLQSLLCAVLFHHYGFRLYGLPLTAALLVAVGIVLFQLLASPLWLSVFQLGPAEWFWRSLAAWRWQPLLSAGSEV